MNRVKMFKGLFEVDLAPMIVKFRQSKRSGHLNKFRDSTKPGPRDANSCVDVGGIEPVSFSPTENVNLPSIDPEKMSGDAGEFSNQPRGSGDCSSATFEPLSGGGDRCTVEDHRETQDRSVSELEKVLDIGDLTEDATVEAKPMYFKMKSK